MQFFLSLIFLKCVCTDANSIDEQERITHEYIEKADNLDDKVGNMKNEKTLTNDFNRYLEKCINLNANKTREKATTAEKKKITRRATRA